MSRQEDIARTQNEVAQTTEQVAEAASTAQNSGNQAAIEAAETGAAQARAAEYHLFQGDLTGAQEYAEDARLSASKAIRESGN